MQSAESPTDPLAERFIKFAYPVCANTGDEEFPIQRIGSGIVLRDEGHFYLLTARHVLSNNRADPLGILIPLSTSQRSETWWLTNGCLHLDSEESSTADNLFGDLAIYSLQNSEEITDRLSSHHFLERPLSEPLYQKQRIFAFGFPDQDADLDVDDRSLIATLVAIEGIYAGATGFTGIGIFESEDLAEVSPNGMSGGPVTAYNLDKIGHHKLAGIIIQGSSASRRLYFITSNMLDSALDFAIPKLRSIIEQDTNPQF